MSKLELLLETQHVSLSLSTPNEIADACRIIVMAQSMDAAECDTLRAAFKAGPLEDGYLPSKRARDDLMKQGLITKVVVNGTDGFNACTHKGAAVYRVLQADSARPQGAA